MLDDRGEVVWINTREPAGPRGVGIEGYHFSIGEMNLAVGVRLGGAVEIRHVEQGWGAGGSQRGEQFIQEAGCAVKKDGFGAEEEIRVCIEGVLIAIELMLGDYAGGVDVVGLVGFVAANVGEIG